MNIPKWIKTPEFHLAMMGAWSFLLIPTVLLWRESVIWVVAMSWYANFVGHWSSYQAARAEQEEKKK